MHPAYFQVRFKLHTPLTSWPREFVIVSAHATTGERWSAAENDDAHRRLTDEIAARGSWRVQITGYSPETGHAEPAWAFVMPVEEACDLGLRYRQDAIYYVLEDRLSVTCCDRRRRLTPVGVFLERLD